MSSQGFEPALLFATTYKNLTRADLDDGKSPVWGQHSKLAPQPTYVDSVVVSGLRHLQAGEHDQDDAFNELLSVHSSTFVRSFSVRRSSCPNSCVSDRLSPPF